MSSISVPDEKCLTLAAQLIIVSILYEIIDWTNLTTVISVNIVDFIGSSNLTGLILLITGTNPVIPMPYGVIFMFIMIPLILGSLISFIIFS